MKVATQSKKSVRKSLLRIVVIALSLTLLQVAIALTCNDQRDLGIRYVTLSQWDSAWYTQIVVSGYYVNPSSNNIFYTNTVFPPGLPLFAFLIKKITGLQAVFSVLLASQIATFVFWMYFMLLARRLKTSRYFTAAGAMSIMLYPASFFFVVGYSDSLFLAMLLGLVYWQSDTRKHSWLLAAVHGCIMTATRIVGIPLVIVPLMYTVFTKGFRGLRDPRPWLVTVISSAGAGAFYLFCKLAFGEWFLQVRAHEYWSTKPDITAIFNPIFYQFWKPFFADGLLHPDYLSIMSFQVLLSFIIIALALELFTLTKQKKSQTFALRMSLYAAALLTWAFTLTARSYNVSSVFRYMIVPEILCVLGLMGWSSAMGAKKTLPSAVFWILILLLFTTIPLQVLYIARYTHRLWVA